MSFWGGGGFTHDSGLWHTRRFWVHCCDCQCIYVWIGSPAFVQGFTEPLPGPPELWFFFLVYWQTSSFTLPTTCTTGKDVWKVWQTFCPKWVLLLLNLHVKCHKQEELIQGCCTSHQLMGDWIWFHPHVPDSILFRMVLSIFFRWSRAPIGLSSSSIW